MDAITIILVILGIFVLFTILGAGAFVWWIKVYKHKFEIYADISGKGYERTKTVRGRLLRIPGSLSEKVYWIPKIKDYVSAYGRHMGKNLYWLFDGGDGFYYNMVAGDLDAKNGMLDVEPVNIDVRAFHTTNKKNIEERYTAKPKNWPLVLMSFTIIFAIVIMLIGGYLIYGKMNEGLSISASASEANLRSVETAERVIGKVEELIDGGKLVGLAPASGGG